MANHSDKKNYPADSIVDLGAPNIDSNDTAMFMQNESFAWDVGVRPAGRYSITKAVGNGQLGLGVKAPALDVATPLVLPPAIIVVLQVPAMYDTVYGLSAMGAAIKDILESHAKQISGIELQYDLEPQGDMTLADGQQFQVPGKVKRTAAAPNFIFTEVTGNLYWNIFRKWITDMNNPDTYAVGADVHVNGGWTMSAYSATIAVIQPDITGRPDRIIDASIICNMFPQTTGALGVERQVGQIKAGGDRSITFSGILQHNAYTKQLGKLIMEKLSMHQLDFEWAPPQRDIWTPSISDIGMAKDSEIRHEYYPRDFDEKFGDVGTGDEDKYNVPKGTAAVTGSNQIINIENSFRG